MLYICFRLILFDSSALNQHVRGEGESAFYWCSKVVTNQQQAATGDICNQSLFVEPIEWMKCQIENVEGKVCRPKSCTTFSIVFISLMLSKQFVYP